MSTSYSLEPNTIPKASACCEQAVEAGLSWSAIVGGALAAAAISIVLVTLGSALGLSSAMPGSSSTPLTFTMKAASWLIFTQWIASGLGGYLAGRLRTKWMHIHEDEMFFRDTAHGFLTWALATLFTAVMLASGAAAIVGTGVKSTAALAGNSESSKGTSKTGETSLDPMAYYTDALLRPAAQNAQPHALNMQNPGINVNTPNPTLPSANEQSAGMNAGMMPQASTPPSQATAGEQETRGEMKRILMQEMRDSSLPDSDKAYMAQIISARTGLSQQEANERVDAALARLNAVKEQAKQDAEQAGKVAMRASLYLSFSMLIGAFIASVAAMLGGHLRDEYHEEYHATKASE